MNICRVSGAWVGTGTNTDAYRPRLSDDYPGIASWVDVTCQPSTALLPNPDAYTVEITCDDATLATIQGDAAYVVLWSEPQPVDQGV